jgi:hypothetical protein
MAKKLSKAAATKPPPKLDAMDKLEKLFPTADIPVEENEQTTVAGDPQVQWVEIRIPVFVGELGNSPRFHRMEAQNLRKAQRESHLRALKGLQHEGIARAARDLPVYLLNQITKALSG